MVDTWIMFLFYDGPSPPKGVFDNFTDIGPIDTTKTWDTFYDLVSRPLDQPNFINMNSSNTMTNLFYSKSP